MAVPIDLIDQSMALSPSPPGNVTAANFLGLSLPRRSDPDYAMA
jgi:hypothetical protein